MEKSENNKCWHLKKLGTLIYCWWKWCSHFGKQFGSFPNISIQSYHMTLLGM